MSKKTLLAVIFITAAALVGLTLLSKTRAGGGATAVNPAFRQYIRAFTSGYVSVESEITVVLAEDTKLDIEAGKPADTKLFSFSPDIDGQAVWVDKRTVKYKPAGRLPSGRDYKVVFHLGKVAEVPADMKAFEFGFSTIRQAIEMHVDNFRTQADNSMQVSGSLSTADVADSKLCEKII